MQSWEKQRKNVVRNEASGKNAKEKELQKYISEGLRWLTLANFSVECFINPQRRSERFKSKPKDE